MTQDSISNEKPANFPSRLPFGFRRMSLGIKLPLIVIGLSALAFLISTFLSVRTSESALIGNLQKTLQEQAVSQADLIRSHLIWTRSMAVDLAAQAATVDSSESDQLKIIEATLANNEQIFGSTIAYEPYRFQPDLYYWSPYYSRSPDGKLRFTQLGNPDYNYFQWDWYTLPKEQRKPVLSPPYYDEGGGEIWMVTWSVPFFDADGKVKGVATADIAFSQTQEIVRQIKVGEHGYAFLVDNQGTLMGIGDQGGKHEIMVDSMLTSDPQAPSQDSGWNTLVNAMTKGDSGFTSVTDPNGNLVFVAYQPIELETGWSLGLVYPQAELLQPVTRSRNTLILFSVLVAVIFAITLSFFTRSITRPLQELASYASLLSQKQLGKGAEIHPIQIQTHDELEELADSFNQMVAKLVNAFETLEEKVADRTHSLQLASEVGRAVSQVRALDEMLTDAAELIREQFNLYYVQVYLTDSSQTNLILRSGTGDVGKQLLARAHRLPFDSTSINGRAAVEQRSIVISSTAESAIFRSNPLLPDTRSEMAVPLLAGQKVVGVLDMQSAQAGALKEENLPAFEALAGQLAIAIQNAFLLAETEQARADVEKQAARLTRANWRDYLNAITKPEQFGYGYDASQVAPLSAADTAQPSENSLVAPISVTGEPIGSLVIELDQEKQTAQTMELVTVVAHQMAQQIENLRLLENAERYRLEAEETTRRATIEGWKKYIESHPDTTLGYWYNMNEVVPAGQEVQAGENVITLPLKAREKIIGKLAVMGIETQDAGALDLANAVAERLSAHLESLRLFDETKRSQVELDKRARELESVAEISSVSSRQLDIQKMLETVVQLTQQRFNLYHAHVFTYNEHTQQLEIAACGWKEGSEHEGTHGAEKIPLTQEQSLVARAARGRQPVIVNNVHDDLGWLPNPLLPDTASELAVPLVVGDQLLGVLDVQSDHLNAFTEEDANIQTTLASQVATALLNARSYEAAQQQAEREAMLNDISQKIQSATTVEAVLQIAARELGHALGAPLTVAQLGIKGGNGKN